MSARVSPPPATTPAATGSARVSRWLAPRLRASETLAAGALFLVAVALRLGLAAHGWPYLNSDEAVMGLMGVDIWRTGAHPVFTYSQDYIGAFQAYLSAPFFALLNGDPLALRLATLLQTLGFLAVMYVLARRLYGRMAALLTLALLTFGPEYALKHELQAGIGDQDTLLFGALTVWLATIRLRGGWSTRARLALDAGIGLAIGLGLWGDFLFLPYVAAATLALLYTALRAFAAARRAGEAWPVTRRLGLDAGVTVLAILAGAAPLLTANIASGGGTFLHVATIAGTPGAGTPNTGALGAKLAEYVGQVGATLLVGLPNALGSQLVCRGCVIWPAAGSDPTILAAIYAALVSALFTVVALGLWALNALRLARDLRRALARTAGVPLSRWADRVLAGPAPDALWWGQFMLVVGSALTVLQYMVSSASYNRPTFTNRYLIGVYIAAPLVAAALAPALRRVWRAARTRTAVSWRQGVATALLALILSLNILGAAHAAMTASDAAMFGDPLNTRDARLVSFLEAHHATDFYTGYWTCGRLILATRERLDCVTLAMDDAFTPGFNRYPPAVRAVAAAKHPAWVFDTRALDVDASVPSQVAACVKTGNPRCAGYTSTTVVGYLIYYYAAG